MAVGQTLVKAIQDNDPVPSVAEALCEVHFRLPTEKTSLETATKPWEPRWFGKMLQQLGSDFDLEPVHVNTIQTGFSLERKSEIPEVAETQVQIDRMIYRHKNGVHLLQLSPGVLTIHQLGKYSGWVTFSQHIHHAWNTLHQVIENFEITRIGLRYINRIPRSETMAPIGCWLSNDEWLPRRMKEQSKGFFFKLDTRIDDQRYFKVSLAEEISNSAIAPLIFDLDIISFGLTADAWPGVFAEINDLHGLLKREFDKSLTPHYRSCISLMNHSEQQT